MNRLSIAVIAPFALAPLLLACPSSESDSGSSGPASSGATPSELDPDAFEFERITIPYEEASQPEQLTVVGDHLFFTATEPSDTGPIPREVLYISDGTEAGTQVLTPKGGAEELTDVDGQLFFATGGLFKVDAAARERVRLAVDRHDGRDGSVRFDPEHLTAFDGALIFSADAQESEGPHAVGRELWISDGTSQGTQLLKNINPDGDSNPGVSVTRDEGFTEAGGVLYFVAEHEDYGKELWTTDGTEEGTRLVKNISSDRGSAPHAITELDGEVYFGAAEEFTLYDLWGSDGTEDGTRKVKEIYTRDREELWGAYPTNFMRYDGRLFFAAQPSGDSVDSEMWVTDGTEAGTERVHEATPAGDHALLDGRLYFRGSHSETGSELWVTDGTSAGTRVVKNINPDEGSAPAHLTVVGGYLFFRADDGEHGPQLWVSNGTEEGTAMLRPDGAEKDALDESFWDFSMTAYDGALYLAARYDDAGLELWRVSVPD